MPINTRKIGAEQEELACNFLIELGYKIIDRNWHWGNRGEIDIVAIDPDRFGEEYLVFVEVKYRDSGMDMSLTSLTSKKIRQLKRLAVIYMDRHGYKQSQTNVTFDFIAMHKDQVEHIKNIV